MKKELDEQLCKKYPKIFRDRHAPMTKTAMCWGFDCGDGWYNIIDKMCANISNYVKYRREDRVIALLMNRALTRAIKGDMSTLNRLPKWAQQEVLTNLKDPEPQFFSVPKKIDVVAVQVKEKYGTLRFYIHGGNEYVDGLVQMATAMSSVTCEVCGSVGKIRNGPWIRTLCDEHAKEQGYMEDYEN